MNSVQPLSRVHPSFTFIQNRHTLRSLAKKAAQILRGLRRSGFQEKYCGPHAAGMALHFWTRKSRHVEQIPSSFDPAQVCREGTTALEMHAALEKITGACFSRMRELSAEKVDSILDKRKPVIALMKVKEEPEEYHWITVVGNDSALYSSLNYGNVELIRKEEFLRACTEIVYPESQTSRKRVKLN